MKQVFKSFVLLGLLFVLSGCLIVPAFGQGSPHYKGRVVDADTGEPVVGAYVALVERPGRNTRTGEDGRFELRPTTQAGFLLLGACSISTLQPTMRLFEVFQLDYGEIEVFGRTDRERYREDRSYHYLQDILLSKNPE